MTLFFQVDYYAAAAVIHELVFQSAMNTYYDNKKKLMRICNIPPRYVCIELKLVNTLTYLEKS